VRGRPIEEVLVIRGVDRARAREEVKGGHKIRLEMRVQHRNGGWLDIEASSMPVKHNGVPTGFVSVMQDVTGRLRMEREAEQRFAELQAANQELESFSYSVSHDLRAPVRAIEGFSRLLVEDYGKVLDDEGQRLLAVVRKNAQRMGVLIDELLAFSRLGRQAITATELDMELLARGAADDARRAEPGRAYTVNIGTLPLAHGDATLIEQVWQNLLANAVKYSRGRTPAVIEVTGERSEKEVVYRVKDNGVGFDMRYGDKLFGVFQRLHADSEFEGTGVGLALVDRIVRRHGGRVWAEAKLGEGATFSFALPGGETK
jgi:light-regulated signal transduction histidine kinase (bacteriophytochrome)